MKTLSLDDYRHVEAAKGWCQLRSFNDANDELAAVTAEHWTHPDTLEARWTVYAHMGRWDGALDLADVINQLAPDQPTGYIYSANSLCELGRRTEALELLLAAVKEFPDNTRILYGIAWLYCTSGRPDMARPWLAKAMAAGGDEIDQSRMGIGALQCTRLCA